MTPASASANGMFPATATPSSSSAACQTGQIEADSSYLYFCTAPNTWKRTAWSSFLPICHSGAAEGRTRNP
jgi:hypothetical protein